MESVALSEGQVLQCENDIGNDQNITVLCPTDRFLRNPPNDPPSDPGIVRCLKMIVPIVPRPDKGEENGF